MKGGRLRVLASANFRRNLERVEAFLEAAGATREFDRLLREIAEEVIPAFEQFPEIGADLLARAPLSAEGRALFAKVLDLLGPEASLRQLIRGDYILLYVVRADAVVLLAIRHHRELSFDFPGHWP
ncbi:MAG: type II toxin-antitoxin system RelE/ParE family toxin [Burkholderiales bacterium]|nr:type II toxin-antitoxin system RelE/ParE family toxin [Burkholderiales bacterium]